MESLLRMSGLLSEEEAGRTDLGTLEKRLAEKATSRDVSNRRTESPAPPKSSTTSSMPESSPRPGSQRDSHDTPQDTVTSPSTDGEKVAREDVENLSEAMCSLVTNNVGETRYIGRFCSSDIGNYLTVRRVFFCILHLLEQRYRMGQRENGRHFIPGNHSGCH